MKEFLANYSEWMDVSAASGMAILFFSFWLVARGYVHQQNMCIRAGKLVGLILILLPLSTYWYLPGSLLSFIGVCIVAVCLFHKLFRGK